MKMHITTILSLLFLINSSVYAVLKPSDIDPSNFHHDMAVIIMMIAGILTILFKGKSILRILGSNK